MSNHLRDHPVVQPRVRLKLCGLTREQDIAPMVHSGADAVGMVFYPKSKRYVPLQQAAHLSAQLPAFVTVTGLFVNPEASFVNQLIQHAALDLLQFHGEESPEFCRQFSRPYIKAFRVGAPGQETAQALLSLCRQYDDAKGWLFDSYTPEYGGSGVAFDENILAELNQLRVETDAPIILAGGLTIENVRAKVQHLHPFALDVSSGIELAPGIKCPTKIAAFVRAITP